MLYEQTKTGTDEKCESKKADSIVERLAAGVTVITATKRLARELRQQFDQQQIELGKHAWESADVLPYDAWLQRLWHEIRMLEGLRTTLPDAPILLNDAQLVAVWEGIIRDDIRHRERHAQPKALTEPLWNPYATAKSAVAAWQILHNWNITLSQCAVSNQPDHRCMLRWAKQFQRLCTAHNWVDRHVLATRVLDIFNRLGSGDGSDVQLLVRHLGILEFSGFAHLLPQQQALLAAMQRANIEIVDVPPPDSSNRLVVFHEYENETTQWLSAAHWAREKQLQSPHTKIAIIAPNMHQAAPAIEYALRQILSPRQLVTPGNSAELPYHFSLGKRLIQYPLIQAALIALAPLTKQALPCDTICQLLRSPFLHGAEREAMARAKLEHWCQRYLPHQIRLTRFLKILANTPDKEIAPHQPACPLFTTALQTASNAASGNPRRGRFSDWAQRFNTWLEHLGWPGERALNSDEYQTVRAFREQLKYLATLDLTTAEVTAGTALSWLQRRLNEQFFQVETHHAPVQVLDVFEAAGQQFDALWFGNLVEADWPPRQRPNPFIAAAVQREAGVFAASIERNHEFASLLQQRIIACSMETVISYPRLEAGIEVQPSALLTTFGAPEAHHDVDPRRHTPAMRMLAHKPQLEKFIDTKGTPFPRHEVAKGGFSLVKNQAQCPFRAFAVHRLGAREFAPNAQGLDAAERGSLIHHALYLVWQAIRTSQKLHSLSDTELHDIVRRAATTANARHQLLSGCGKRFQQVQIQWAHDTVRDWLEVDKRRTAPFTVQALEKSIKVTLSGIELKLKIDRIDEAADGAHTIIDYKTGSVTLRGWLDQRVQDPQIPLYAIAQQQQTQPHTEGEAQLAQSSAIETLAYARVKRRDCSFTGLTKNSTVSDAFKVGRKPSIQLVENRTEFANWEDMLQHWRTTLAKLANEFLAGEARVEPLPNACQYCGLDGFCRISEADEVSQTDPSEGIET